MRLSNFCFPTAVAVIALTTSTISAPVYAQPRSPVPLVGGSDPSNIALYMCYGSFTDENGRQSTQVGKNPANSNTCYIGYGGRERSISNFTRVYVTDQQLNGGLGFVWAEVSNGGSIPTTAAQYGTDINGARLYPCFSSVLDLNRGEAQEVGKAYVDNQGRSACHYGYYGSEQYTRDFYVLLHP